MKEHGPWKIKSSEVKYKNPWIEVEEHGVTRPDGTDGIFGIVSMHGGVSVLPMEGDDVFLTEEFRFAIGRLSMEVVSGAIDEGETPLESARRELKEEIGARADEWIDLGSVDPLTSIVYDPAQIFLARGLAFTDATRDANEVIRIVKIPFNEAVQKVMRGDITHGPSCVLILKVARFLEKGSV